MPAVGEGCWADVLVDNIVFLLLYIQYVMSDRDVHRTIMDTTITIQL